MKPIMHLFTAGLLLIASQVLGQAIVTNLTPATVTAAIGSTVDLQLKVTNFTNVNSVQLPITYNSAVLQFTSIDNSSLPGFTNGNYNATTGKVNVSWFADPGTYPTGFTLPANTSIFTLHFTVLTNGSTTVNIASVPPGIEVIANNAPVTVNYQSGGSTVTGGSGGPPPVQGFAIIANTIYIPQGTTGCMPVTVNDFTNIVSMQYAMHWDNTVLQFQNTQAYNLPDLTAGSFGGTPATGLQLVGWTDPTALGVTRANGTKIYDVCFKGIGAVGSSSLITIDGNGFGQGNGTAEAFNAASQNVWTATSGVTDTIYVVTTPPPANAVTFTADKDTVGQGATACVEVRVKNFNSIIAMQYGMTYNASQLQFVSITPNTSVPGLTAASFNTTVAGEIKFSWSDPAALGVTLPDNTLLFTICFTAVAPVGTTSPVNFTSLPGLPIEIVKEPDGPVTPALNNGLVHISNVVPTVNVATQAACAGGTGTATANVTNGTATSYSWTGPGGPVGGNSQTITGLASGNYTVVVTLTGGGTISNSGTVQSSSAIQIPTPQLIITNVQCFGLNNGSISLTTTGGISPYNYAWSGPGTFTAATEDISGLAPGNYVLTITDNVGCSMISQPYQVTEPQILNVSLVSSQNVACFGDSTGQAVISVSGGSPTYNYAWKTVPGGVLYTNFKNPAILPAGAFNVTVTDSRGCTDALDNPVNITGPATELSVATPVQKTDVLCNGANTGSISLSIQGGWGNPNVTWTPQIPGGANPINIPAGSYIPTITDAGGCSLVLQAIDVLQPDAVVYDTAIVNHVSCANAGDGSITIELSGGNGSPYTVNWGVLSGTTISALSGGDYLPTVTDSEGCTAVLPAISVDEPDPITFSDVNISDAPNGTISLTIGGGSGTLSFAWSGPNGFTAVTEDIGGLNAGFYTITVTDDTDCTITQTFEVEGDALVVIATSTPSCGNDGCINLQMTGAPPFTISVNGGIYLTNDFTISICTFAPGFFTPTIADNNGNVVTLSPVNVPQLQPALVSPMVVPPNMDLANGSITLSPVPTGTPMTYNWTGPNGFTSNSNAIMNRDSGLYLVTVTNVNSGCTAVYSYALTRIWPAIVAAVAQTDQPNCSNTADGGVTLNISGGNPPYTFAWSGPNGFTAATKDITGAAPGQYFVTITDENGSTIIQSATLTAQSQLAVTNVNETSNYGNGFQVSGAAECDGAANVVFGGGVGSITILWSNSVTSFDNETLCAGAYSVTVTDELGCTASWTGELTAPPAITPSSLIVQDVGCHGECDGIASLFVNGGIAPYIAVWSNGQVDVNLQAGEPSTSVNLCGGDYKVTITDKLGATNVFTVVVPEAPEIVLVFNTVEPTALNACNAEIIVEAPGAVAPATYTWSSSRGLSGSGQRAEGLCAGDVVDFVVVDANGCTIVGRDTIGYPEDDCYLVRPVITPGLDDGNNDYAHITCIEAVPNSIEIYNRWGQLVFEADGYDNSAVRWEGKNKAGQPLAEGVYFYVLNFTDPLLGQQQRKGHINLLR